MLARVSHTIGRGLRETGQALNVLGYAAAEEIAHTEHVSRHRRLMPLYDVEPSVAPGSFVAPCATLVGDVSVAGGQASVWYGAVLRGDANSISVGAGSNIQDNTVIKTTDAFATVIGEKVTVGHNVTMTGCTIGDNVLVGMGAVIGEGAVVESGAFLAAGSVVPPGMTVPGGKTWSGNPLDLSKPLKDTTDASAITTQAEKYLELANQHISAVSSLS